MGRSSVRSSRPCRSSRSAGQSAAAWRPGSTPPIGPCRCPEVEILGKALLAGFLERTRLTEAGRVRGMLGHLCRGSLGFRGGLLRIVDRVGPAGSIAPSQPHQAYAAVKLTPAHTALSDLLKAVQRESASIRGGAGFPHSFLNVGGTSHPLLRALRDAAYRQYEYSALAIMALAATEFLIQTAAESAAATGAGRSARGRVRSSRAACRSWHGYGEPVCVFSSRVSSIRVPPVSADRRRKIPIEINGDKNYSRPLLVARVVPPRSSNSPCSYGDDNDDPERGRGCPPDRHQPVQGLPTGFRPANLALPDRREDRLHGG